MNRPITYVILVFLCVAPSQFGGDARKTRNTVTAQPGAKLAQAQKSVLLELEEGREDGVELEKAIEALRALQEEGLEALRQIDLQMDELANKDAAAAGQWLHEDFSGLIYNAIDLGAPEEEVVWRLDILYAMAAIGKYNFGSVSEVKTQVDLMKQKLARREASYTH